MLFSLCSGSCAGVCISSVVMAQQLSYTDFEEIQFPVQRGKMVNISLCFPFSSLSSVVGQVFEDTCVLFREPCFFPGEIRVGRASKDSPLGRIQLSPLILH